MAPKWQSLDSLLTEVNGSFQDLNPQDQKDWKILNRIRDAAQREHNWEVAAQACQQLGKHYLYDAALFYGRLGQRALALDLLEKDGSALAIGKLMLYYLDEGEVTAAKNIAIEKYPTDFLLLKLLPTSAYDDADLLRINKELDERYRFGEEDIYDSMRRSGEDVSLELKLLAARKVPLQSILGNEELYHFLGTGKLHLRNMFGAYEKKEIISAYSAHVQNIVERDVYEKYKYEREIINHYTLASLSGFAEQVGLVQTALWMKTIADDIRIGKASYNLPSWKLKSELAERISSEIEENYHSWEASQQHLPSKL